MRKKFISDYQSRINMQNGIETEIKNGKYNAFITLATNNECHIEFVKKMIRHWNNDINSRIFRYKRFHNNRNERSKYDDCFRYIGFLETNEFQQHHYHLIAYVHHDKYRHFCKVALRFWKKKIKSGTIDIKLIEGTPDKLASYVTKKLDNSFSLEHYIIS